MVMRCIFSSWVGGQRLLFACIYDPDLMQFADKRLRAGV
jgi:hypothetical protein